jgi:hypothetical protein
MKSVLAERSREDLGAHIRGMTAEQRLQAFLVHCQLVMALNRAGPAIAPGSPRTDWLQIGRRTASGK